MVSFLAVSVLSVLTIVLTSMLTYEVLRITWNTLPHMHMRRRLRVLFVIAVIFGLHILIIWLYGAAYFLIENLTSFGRLSGSIGDISFTYDHFVERLYFSAATYSSLWIGDVVPTSDLRMLASAEVLNGLILIGWTISFTYLVMEKFWTLPERKHHEQ